MEILLITLYYILAFGIAGWRRKWSWRGWAEVWFFLFLIGGLLRWILEFVPVVAPMAGKMILILASCFILITIAKYIRKMFDEWYIQKIFTLIAGSSPYILIFGFLFYRSFYPQFDVDSLTYHLSGIQFLYEREALPPLQQSIEAAGVQFAHLGFEDFLLIPGLGYDLSLFGGLVQGFLKILTLFSILSLIPGNAIYLRIFAVYLLLTDDHFFFSGQNTYVYINPSMIGLVAMAGWLSFNALQGRWLRGIYSIPLAMGVAGDKYQGVYFLIPFALIASAGLIRSFYNAADKYQFTIQLFKKSALPVASGAILLSASYGLNWLLLGSPVYPFNIVWIKVEGIIRYLDHWQKFGSTVSVGLTSINPFRALIFPGNTAMKITAVLFLPCAFLFFWCFFFVKIKRKQFLFFRIRFLFLALLGFAFTFFWAIQANNITPGESRYPRYVYGLSILSTVFLIASIRMLPSRINFGIFVSRFVILPVFFGMIFYLVYITDIRGSNVWPGQRPKNSEVLHYALAYFKGDKCAYSQDPEKCIPYWNFLEPYSRNTIKTFAGCSLANPEKISIEKILSGRGILLMTSFDNWPRFFVARGAIRNDIRAGGYFRTSMSIQKLKSEGISYVLLSERLLSEKTSAFSENEFNKELLRSIKGKNPICASEDTMLFEF